jgi:hypothetical protein
MSEARRTRPGIEWLQERDLAILQGLFESRLMTLTHVTHLYFNGRGEAAKKRIQRLKRERFIRERARRVYQPSILHLSRRAFAELSSRGMLLDYPSLTWNQLEDRARVSELTLRHELAVLDVKTALSCAIRNVAHYELVEFSTWPLLYQFQAAQPPLPGTYHPARALIRPDGFVRLHEHAPDGDRFEHFFFLEVDRSTEPWRRSHGARLVIRTSTAKGDLPFATALPGRRTKSFPSGSSWCSPMKSAATTWRSGSSRMSRRP